MRYGMHLKCRTRGKIYRCFQDESDEAGFYISVIGMVSCLLPDSQKSGIGIRMSPRGLSYESIRRPIKTRRIRSKMFRSAWSSKATNIMWLNPCSTNCLWSSACKATLEAEPFLHLLAVTEQSSLGTLDHSAQGFEFDEGISYKLS